MDLATMVIRLEAQSATLQQNLDAATTRLKKFQSDTKSSLSAIDEQFAGLGNGLKTLVTTLVGVGAIKTVISDTVDAQQASAQLAAAIELNGRTAGVTGPQLERMAQNLADTSTFSLDAVHGMQALLLTFTNIRGPVLQDAQKAIADVATRLGVDLKTAAEIVGKALDNPIQGLGSLQKAGVRLTDTQKDNIKYMAEFGDVTGAQETVLKAIEDRFGGAADAARNTFGGALQDVKNSVSDLLAQGDGLPAATSALKDLVTVLKDPGVKQGVDSIFSTIITAAAKAVDLLGKTAAGLKIIATGKGGNDAVDVDNRIADLQAQLNSINQGRVPGIEPARDQMAAQLTQQIADLKQRFDLVTEGAVDADGQLKEFQITATRLAEPVHDLGEKLKEAGAQFGSMEQDAKTALNLIVSQMDALGQVGDPFFDQTGEKFQSAIDQAFGAGFKKEMDSLDKFKSQYETTIESLAHGTQGIIESTLENGFKGGFKGVEQAVAQMLLRIGDQIIAADLTNKLFGGTSAADITSNGGGWIGTAAKFIGGLFSSGADGGAGDTLSEFTITARDSGGPGVPGRPYFIGTGAQPELFVPSTPGSFIPANQLGGKPINVTNNFTLAAPASRATQSQISLRVGQSIAQAQRMNG